MISRITKTLAILKMHSSWQGVHIHSLGEVVEVLRVQPGFDFIALWDEIIKPEHPLKW